MKSVGATARNMPALYLDLFIVVAESRRNLNWLLFAEVRNAIY